MPGNREISGASGALSDTDHRAPRRCNTQLQPPGVLRQDRRRAQRLGAAYALDLSDRKNVDTLARSAPTTDLLVNNAGAIPAATSHKSTRRAGATPGTSRCLAIST